MPDPERDLADQDARFMAAAIRLGVRELGRTWPNPAVGCLIVAPSDAGSVVVGRGWTRAGGRPHAEAVALAEAGAAAQGATAYISLEPCAHHGKTPPCTESLANAGIGRVVSALEDPDPRVSGRGHASLLGAGVEVVTGVGAHEARQAHAGHLMRVREGRPWVTLKLAVSRDGRIAGPQRQPLAITGEQARARSHMLRATHDGILVGIGTAIADDPELTCRLPGMEGRSPVRVILDSALRLAPEARVLRAHKKAPVWIVTAGPADPGRADALAQAGAEVIEAEPDSGGKVAVGSALSALAARGLTRVLVEGGAAVAGAFLDADFVDESVIFASEMTIGAGGLEAIPSAGLARLTAGGAYRRVDEQAIGADRMVVYRRVR